MQCFVVNSDELKQRFDPFSHTPQFKSFLNDQTKSKYSIKLGSIISSGSYGVLPPSECYSEGGEILLVRATELMPDFEIDFTNSIPVPNIFYESERARLRKNDILLAVKGATIASNKSVCFVDDEPPKSIVNGSIFRFQVKEGINSKYVAIALCLETSKKQMNMLLIANNAVNYLDRNIINNLLISLPPLSIQNQIVDIMQSAYAQKKQIGAEAQRLLDSIDGYVLNELGIKLPEIKNKKCFLVWDNEVVQRLDPLYYAKDVFSFLKEFSYDVKPLEGITYYLKTGFAAGSSQQEAVDKGIIQIRPTNIDELGLLRFDKNIYLKKEYLDKKNDSVTSIL